jgi:transposase
MSRKVMGYGSASRLHVWWLVSTPMDFRCGIDRLLVRVHEVLGRDPLDGSAYVFRNRKASRIKVLVVDAQGVWLSVRRLHQGRFIWPSSGQMLWSLSRAQVSWLYAGVDWQRLSVAMPVEKRV